ncbi:MAG: class II aldolase/adducin family protein [Verrucomicrobia bacterium]|nr:class II aldolase/adducin family protein [Verrucomicrobiota bacterium]
MVGEVAKNHHSILMLNHGVITWGDHIEDAYWKMENTESYCKTVWIASQLGNGLQTISQGQARELIELRKSLGMFDKRDNWKECELCDNSEFHPGVVCTNVPVPVQIKDEDCGCDQKQTAEAVVQRITDLIMEQIGSVR